MNFRMMPLALALTLVSATSASAQTRVEKIELGRAIYTRDCATCHDNSQHMLNDNGPALFGVVGRRVGALQGYEFSPALKAANATGKKWSADKLDRFLTNPAAMYPGTSMVMNFDDSRMRSAIIAYLKTLKTKN